MKNSVKHFYFILAALTALAVFSTCDTPLSLGKQLYTNGPEVRISFPVIGNNQTNISVGSIFMLAGTAESVNEIVRMEITVQYSIVNENGEKEITSSPREWLNDRGNWRYKADSSVDWKDFTAADYEGVTVPDNVTISAPSWQKEKTGDVITINWSLPIILPSNYFTGDYTITASAWDSAGNYDSNSSATVKVYYVNDVPQFRIGSPFLRPGVGIDDPEIPDAFYSFIYDPVGDPDGTYRHIRNWFTKDQVTFAWRINDEAPDPPFSLTFQITNKHNIKTGVGKVVYYEMIYDGTNRLQTKEGIIPVDFSNLLAEPTVSPAYLQVVTRLTDSLGKEQHVSQGFFAYRPEADKPWIDLKFGYKENPNETTPSNAPDGENNFMIRGTENDRSQVFSRHGLESLSWELYKLEDSGLTIAKVDGVDVKKGEGTFNFPGSPLRATWNFHAKPEFGAGRFKIMVTVEDVNGNSDTFSAYFRIENNDTPTVKSFNENLSGTTTYFGDGLGNITISGIAELNDDETPNHPNHGAKVDRVTLVWIKPAGDAQISMMNYDNRDYAGWNAAKNLSPGVAATDSAGNKVWEIGATFSGFDGNSNENEMEEWKFEKVLNLFKDLGIVNGGFTNQTFFVRVASDSSKGELASVRSFSMSGDAKAPEIKINTVTIYKHDNSFSSQRSFNPNNNSWLGAIYQGDIAVIEGVWDDDSLQAWSGIYDINTSSELASYGFTNTTSGKNALLSLFKDFTIRWEGDEDDWDSESWANTNQLILDINEVGGEISGTWKCTYTFSYDNTDPIATIIAGVSDLSNNRDPDSKDVNIETDFPELIGITSDLKDGTYGNKPTYENAGTYRPIVIYMDFNKDVKFADGDITGIAPRLILNNDGRAFYKSGNGTSRLTFIYYVNGVIPESGDYYTPHAVADLGGSSTPLNGTKLNVTGIDWQDYEKAKWVSFYGSSEVLLHEDNRFAYNGRLSLSAQKNIVIDKDAPTIKSIVTTAGNSRRYGVGRTININVDFSEPVTFSSNPSSSNFHLKLTGGNLNNRPTGSYTKTGQSSVMFSYVVLADDDTKSTGTEQYLNISQFHKNGFEIIDEAGNPLTSTALPNSGQLRNGENTAPANIMIDAVKPAPPNISIPAGTYYGTDTKFNITGIDTVVDGTNVTVQYRYDWNNSMSVTNPPTNGWTTAASPYTNIPLSSAGDYNIAVRQADYANPVNWSNVNYVGAPGSVGKVTIETEKLLTGISSDTQNGLYGEGTLVTLRLTFRKSLLLTGGTLPFTSLTAENNSAYLNLQIGSNYRKAYLQSISGNVWTFSYTSASDESGFIGVPSFYIGSGLTISDAAGTQINNNTINYAADIGGNTFRSLYSIEFSSGNPRVVNNGGIGSSYDIKFLTNNQLTFKFDRPIYSGDPDAELKVLIVSGTDNYRIPSVLDVAQWQMIFQGRTGLPGFSTATEWENMGKTLYYQGSNGADSEYKSDATIKYILNYIYNTDTLPTVSGKTGDVILEAFRQAEALRFSPYDPEVEVVGDTLTVNFPNTKKLPVSGVKYEMFFPNNFVKDILGRPNGGTTAGNDSNLSTNAAVRQFTTTGLEEPKIRINKSNETITSGQAVQPTQAGVKIDCRTPSVSISYRTRQSTDSVSALINSSGAETQRRLPNLGSTTDISNFNAGKNRPQSGGTGWPTSGAGGGFSWWAAPSTWTGYVTANNFNIGDTNYYTGGMIIHIEATAAKSGETSKIARESAYRSVLVFDNRNTGGNTNVGSGLTNARVWVRGGDAISGSSSVPDFPISRDRSKPEMARLLTPISPTPPPPALSGPHYAVVNGTVQTNVSRGTLTTVANSHIGNMGGGDVDNRWVEFSGVNVGSSGSVVLVLSYARGWQSVNVPTIRVNGTGNTGGTVYNALLAQGNWGNYTTVAVTINLNSGNNTIRIMGGGGEYEQAPACDVHYIAIYSSPYTDVPSLDSNAMNGTYNNEGNYLWYWVTWRLNKNAYIDIFSAGLNATIPSNSLKMLYMGYTYAKEHYPVIPGRTTVISGGASGDWDYHGTEGKYVRFGAVEN